MAMLGGSIALTALLGATVTGPAWADDRAGTIDGVQVRDGRVELVLTAPELAAGTAIDPDYVAVTLGGKPVSSTATVAGGEKVSRSVVLLIDISGSMKGAGIDAAKVAGSAFVAGVAPDVRLGVVTFNDVPRVVLAPTTDRAAARRAIAALSASKETALYDGVVAGIKALGTAGDRTLVVLSDGGDTVSLATLQTAVRGLSTSGVRAEVVGFRTDESQDQVLAGLAAAGQGRVSSASDARALALAFQQAVAALTTQVQISAAIPEGMEGERRLEVSARAGGDTVRADTMVLLPRAAAAPVAEGQVVDAAAPTAVAGAVPLWLDSPWIAAVLIALMMLLLTLLVIAPWIRSTRPSRREQVEFYGLQGRMVLTKTPTDNRQFGQPVLDVAESFVRRRGMEARLALLMDRADLPWRPHEYVVLTLSASLAALAVTMLLTDSWIVRLLAPFAGWIVVAAFVRVRGGRRLRRFTAQLPDALALVASSLQTGFSLNQALDAIARDTNDPLRGEMGRAVAEARLGAEIEASLEKVADRMNCDDLRWTVMAIRIQRQVGGNLAETLRTTTKTLRDRASLRRHVKALSADGRISAYVLVGLPILMTAGLFLIAPEYISLLWSNPIGILMLVVAVVGMVVGSLWMGKIVRVEM
jgi:tight adherence protein B